MGFNEFLKTLHGVIGNKALYEFTVELFDSSTDENLYLNVESVKNWFRNDKRNQSYIKSLHMGNFNAVKLNTFLKARTMGSWRKLQTSFRCVSVENPECLINFVTDNHDKFLESIEWQFKAILRIPIVVDSDIDTLTFAINADDGHKIEYVDISEALLVERRRDIKVYEKWSVLNDLQLEMLIIKRFPEILKHGVRKGIRYSYFLYGVSENHIDAFSLELSRFSNEFAIINLQCIPSYKSFIHIPKWGYCLYITDESDKFRGYMYNKFHEMKSYKAFHMNQEETYEVVSRLMQLSDMTQK